jgi:hypothetical protein
VVARLGILVLVACSSGKPKQIEDATRTHDAAGSSAVSSVGSPVPADRPVEPSSKLQTTGDVQVRVEWPTMPLAARVSPGASACGAPLPAQVSPTTTWGIPDVVVFVEGAPPSTTASSSGSSRMVNAHDARIAIDRCTVTPRTMIGSRITIASAADHPVKASIAKRFGASDPKIGVKAPVIPIALPIAGHEVTVELEADAIYRVGPEGKEVGDGYVVSATAFITDATGVALVKDVPPGKHAVRVWLPPRGGQPARSAKGDVTVEVGDLAEITLTLD